MTALAVRTPPRWAHLRRRRLAPGRLAVGPRRGPDGELSWDPEGLFGPSSGGGLIARRQLEKRLEQDKEFAAKVAEATTEMQREALSRRAERTEPQSLEDFVEYFLNTEMEDMQYETIGTERFAAEPDEDRLAELESLRSYLEEAVTAIDRAVSESETATVRLKKLLEAKDKKAMILKMVSANEIDTLFVEFMNQNIEAARAADEGQKAEFMEKLRDACKRYC